MIYACQEKVWMDKAIIKIWINLVLIPWRNTWGPEVVPLLVLDSYHVHMMHSTANHIQALGIDVQHISAGCTYLYQPMEVGIDHFIIYLRK